MNETSQYGLMTEHHFTILHVDLGYEIILVRNSDGVQKKFFVAESQSGYLRMVRLREHMQTLTDSQCESFFDDNKTKKAKKPKAS